MDKYRVIFSYDKDYLSDYEFRKKLSRCLLNLHSRRGWLYFGAFCRSPGMNLLHFYGILYVPKGEMVGALVKFYKSSLDCYNTFFEKRFGFCKFRQFEDNYSCNNVVGYIKELKHKEGILCSKKLRQEFNI